jgi:hypothetical protein
MPSSTMIGMLQLQTTSKSWDKDLKHVNTGRGHVCAAGDASHENRTPQMMGNQIRTHPIRFERMSYKCEKPVPTLIHIPILYPEDLGKLSRDSPLSHHALIIFRDIRGSPFLER